jgi:hypothetical protein
MNVREAETQRLVLQLEIAEAEDRRRRLSGKTRAGSATTDEKLALQVHMGELQLSLQVLGDDHIARSISHAMDRDANILAHYQALDTMESEDRRMAMSLAEGGHRTLSSVSRSSKKTKERVCVAPVVGKAYR